MGVYFNREIHHQWVDWSIFPSSKGSLEGLPSSIHTQMNMLDPPLGVGKVHPLELGRLPQTPSTGVGFPSTGGGTGAKPGRAGVEFWLPDGTLGTFHERMGHLFGTL